MSTVGVVFGSRSVEHEVSVITAHQAMAALSTAHRAVPVYIAKDGRWYTGDALGRLAGFNDVGALLRDCTVVTPLIDPSRRELLLLPEQAAGRGLFGRGSHDPVAVEVVMPLVHGTFGEDGTLQGLLEMAGVAYTGSGVAASAVAMDKRLAKTVLRAAGLPVLDDVPVSRDRWQSATDECVRAAEALSAYPLYVKPVSLGSSIGVSRVGDRAALHGAVDAALTYDPLCIVEAAQEGIIEVNCAVLGDESGVRASLLEQPTKRGLLSYDDKYRAGGAKDAPSTAGMKGAQRIVPAPLDAALTARLRDVAVAAFTAVGACGVARIDLMVDARAGTFVVNEVNPVPGSLAYYLFEPDGLSFTALLDELIEIASRRQARRLASTLVFDTWMLGGGGAKTAG